MHDTSIVHIDPECKFLLVCKAFQVNSLKIAHQDPVDHKKQKCYFELFSLVLVPLHCLVELTKLSMLVFSRKYTHHPCHTLTSLVMV